MEAGEKTERETATTRMRKVTMVMITAMVMP
jgi:hypothetical protein